MLRRLLAFADAPRPRVALVVGLGAATVLCGVGLMATSGYLISRAAEQPPILALTVTIVAVRFFGLGAAARALPRAARVARPRAARARPRAGSRLRARRAARARGADGHRRGDLLSRLVADVDELQNLHLRGVGPPLVALAAGAVSSR